MKKNFVRMGAYKEGGLIRGGGRVVSLRPSDDIITIVMNLFICYLDLYSKLSAVSKMAAKKHLLYQM